MKKQHKIFSKAWNKEITLTLDESLNGIEKSEASKRRVAEMNAFLRTLKYPITPGQPLSEKEWKKLTP